MKKSTSVFIEDFEFICTQNKKFVDITYNDKYLGHIMGEVPDMDDPDFNILSLDFDEVITNFATLIFFSHSMSFDKVQSDQMKSDLIKSYSKKKINENSTV